MDQTKSRLTVLQEDYEVMSGYLRGASSVKTFDKVNVEELESELKNATIVPRHVFPKNVVRLNSRVLIKDEKNDKIMEVTLVIPEKADIKNKMISFLAPVGTALIGFKEGEKVKWNVPSGKREFVIVKVINS